MNCTVKIQLFHWRLPPRTLIKNYYIQLFHIFCVNFFFTLILRMQLNIQQYYPSFYTFYALCFFPWLDTRPTQVGDMDPWPVTWPNLNDLIGWGQQISCIFYCHETCIEVLRINTFSCRAIVWWKRSNWRSYLYDEGDICVSQFCASFPFHRVLRDHCLYNKWFLIFWYLMTSHECLLF